MASEGYAGDGVECFGGEEAVILLAIDPVDWRKSKGLNDEI